MQIIRGNIAKHPRCKLIDFRLPVAHLGDEGISILCYSLFGNSTIKKLSFVGNADITPVGLWALSNIIRHPNCKLVELGLYDTGINDESASVLGSALSGFSLKVLDLASNKSINRTGWQMLFNQLSQSSIVSLDLNCNCIEDSNLIELANLFH
jgi:hypothetical protein